MIRALAALACLSLLGAATPAAPPPPAELAWQVDEGRNLNAFLRDGPVAAHLLLRSGTDPRVIVAFPAGNSGVGVWFEQVARAVRWRLDSAPIAIARHDEKGRTLHGVSAQISVNAASLRLRGAVLSSTRVLRDFERTGEQPALVVAPAGFGPRAVNWHRDRLDGAPGYALTLRVIDGTIDGHRLLAGNDGRIALELTALTGEPPLAGLTGTELLRNPAAADPRQARVLQFLSYREKFLAGSWRFNTYFGRDTLISVRLLMPALQPRAIEAGLGSVLARLSPQGEVAHEEDVGEFAVLDHLRVDGSRSATPIYDYKMVDETPMLASVAAHWLLDDPRAHDRARAFLAAPADAGRSNGAALVANLLRVVDEGAAFAADPRSANLVALKPGFNVGNWRDSEEGLGGGRYAYDVNAVLMPAALAAAARLEASGLLAPWLDPVDSARLRRAAIAARRWEAQAPGLFDVRIPPATARRAVIAEAREAGISPRAALASLPPGMLHFSALALDAGGRPIAVVHSDEGFALLFARPAPRDLEAMVRTLMRPFPAGLMSDAGLLVANPAFAGQTTRALFSPRAYHGEVVWSWQQALLLAGFDRQLARGDLPKMVRGRLLAARSLLSGTIARTQVWQNSELWSWRVRGGKMVPAAFGASAADADEANAAQLWSTVFLGLPHQATALPATND